ncbi:liver carboxylesterase 1-like [Lingula anatina]|uniref:Carboxylic ester hydrolase n=1 Tax=Lingula anatina TaxID=7574 RepID=A0A1S3JEJ9_LINAN|nr:liver carboxylesterase 1-like [Lingula anatina]|eukprot:XP_013408837.1 liver carboxylesterase 1-like [Lingula anatina]
MASTLVVTVKALLTLSVMSGVAAQPQVTTKNGVIEGFGTTVEGQSVNLFLGIPFAEPPVGALRFMKPQPPSNWTGVKQTIAFGAACMQTATDPSPYGDQLSEDCLTLNVFVPGAVSSTNRKAVMVWIYGGAYTTGGTSLYIFNEFAAQNDVIVVSVNYRVGPFGFLTTGNADAPGNAGLWDQIEGLKWVQDNIRNFGGDPNNVTIFGESAGGGSVSQLAMTVASRGLFQRFISMSGTALSDWAWVKDGPDVATKIGQHLGCNAAASLVDCLRAANATALLRASDQSLFPGRLASLFAPVVDGDMFPRSVEEMLQDPNSTALTHFLSLDYMGGFTDSDGGVNLPFSPINITLGVPPTYMRDSFIPYFAAQTSAYHRDEIAEKLREVYYDANANMAETGRLMVNLYTDTMFSVPTVGFLRSHLMASGGSTYLYYFTKEPSFPHLLPVPAWFKGVNHGDELAFLLGPASASLLNVTFTELEKNVSRAFMTYYANFAKTGNPNTPDTVPSPWPQYSYTREEYLDIGDVIVNKTDVIPRRIDLWLDTIPAILARSTTSAPSTTPVASKGVQVQSSAVLAILVMFYVLKLFY